MSGAAEGAVSSWTCSRCEVTASWMAGSELGGCPADWRRDGGNLYCLGCRRALAAEEAETGLEDETLDGRSRARTRAMIEFEIRRAPDHANSVIARACRTSVPAVAKARERIGIPAPDKRGDGPGRPPRAA